MSTVALVLVALSAFSANIGVILAGMAVRRLDRRITDLEISK